jgi:hypothetical protein
LQLEMQHVLPCAGATCDDDMVDSGCRCIHSSLAT